MKPKPKEGDLRIRQVNYNKFWVEEYNLEENFYCSNAKPYWQHIYVHKQSGYKYSYHYDRGTLQEHDVYFETIEDAKSALKRRSELLADEQYRKDNYVNVYYPTEFKKEKFNEDK